MCRSMGCASLRTMSTASVTMSVSWSASFSFSCGQRQQARFGRLKERDKVGGQAHKRRSSARQQGCAAACGAHLGSQARARHAAQQLAVGASSSLLELVQESKAGLAGNLETLRRATAGRGRRSSDLQNGGMAFRPTRGLPGHWPARRRAKAGLDCVSNKKLVERAGGSGPCRRRVWRVRRSVVRERGSGPRPLWSPSAAPASQHCRSSGPRSYA